MVKIVSISLILLAIIAITYGRSTEYKVAIQKQDKTYERKDESGYEASLHLNIGVNSNSEDDNTSEGNTGEGNTSEGNTGKDNTGEDNTGEDNTGEGNTDGVENLQDIIKNLKEEFEATKSELESARDVIKNLKEEFKTTKSELESAINASKSELESAIETSNGEIAKNTASIKTSNGIMNNLKEEFNTTKSELESAIETSNDDIAKNTASIKTSKDRITRLENKTQMLTPEPTTPEPTTPESTTPAPTTQTTTPEPKLSDEERIAKCGFISSIGDESITASSVAYNDPRFGPQHSRLYTESGDGGWRPHHPYHGSWIEIDMGTTKKVRGVATQGRSGGHYWTKSFTIGFKTSTSSNFQYIQDKSGYKKIFQGNTDRNTVVINDIDVEGRFIRIYPISWNNVLVLRFDVLLC